MAGRLATNASARGEIRYRYDAAGLLTNLHTSTPYAIPVSYAYDALGRLTNVVGQASPPAGAEASSLARYTYDAVGNLDTVTAGNDVEHRYRYRYDRMNRLTNLVVASLVATQAAFAYRLDATGHRTRLDQTVNGSHRVYQWSYDKLHRLTNETVSGGPSGTLTYGYDDVGNRSSRSGSLGGLGAQMLNYDWNDRIDNDANPNNGSTYFDANGNTTSLDGAWQYDWANRLTNYNNGTASYVYDADGNRIKQTAGGVTTWYLVATVNPSGWPQVVEEHTGASPGTLSRRYTYGHDLISQSRWTGGGWETHFYLTDGLGSTRALLNASGAISDTYVYDAFGTLIASSGSTPNNYLFAGEQWDAAIGQYYLRARTLHPGYGRFWTMDRHEGTPTDPLSLHKYLYCHADPVNRLDPSGHESLVSLMAATGIHMYLRSVYDTVVLSTGFALEKTIFGVQAGKSAEAIVTEYVVETVAGAAVGFALGKVLGRAFDLGDEAAAVAAEANLFKEAVATRLPLRTRVFRVYVPGMSNKYGKFWTTVDPRKVKNYADAAGLPKKIADAVARGEARFVAAETGTTEQVMVRAAENSGGNRGGLFEVQIENAEAMLRNVKEFPF